MYAKLRLMPRYHSSSIVLDVPKGHCSIYVGESIMKRFVIPLEYVQHPSFQTLLNLAEEEFGYAHPMGEVVVVDIRGGGSCGRHGEGRARVDVSDPPTRDPSTRTRPVCNQPQGGGSRWRQVTDDDIGGGDGYGGEVKEKVVVVEEEGKMADALGGGY
ncbi:hypothetical protein OSB04_022135 [Centaurea solstitialis]|uniref:Uncharacterized protein n=1 Tax=Centaurea solstitialis TaxID=347529 RepID=A0AA38W5M0_9ASTR|nr:hypothetical protein OSB04_022135 [Centaurea solstitialis]